MRDIARNFQALPLVSWMVWIAMAVIAAPVMALPTESIFEDLDSESIRLVASKFEEIAQQSEFEDPAAVDSADIIIKLTDPEDDALADDANEATVETANDAAAGAAETDPAFLVQEDSSELASPSDPFFFDENSVEAPGEGVLAPLSETEELPDGIAEGEAELDDAPLTPPQLRLQTAAIQEGDDFSARARVYGHYFLRSNVAVVGAVDLSTGNAFSDTDSTGFNISELFVVASPPNAPELRGAVGLIELTSFFDRNSFAKDSLTHFINPVFQTNPALATTQLESQPAALLHWRPIDEVILKAAAFSSGGFDDLDFDAVAGEIGVNLGNLIVRGTYVSATDDGDRDGIPESFQINRNGVFGPQEGDREVSYGINAEWFIPELNAGLFGRYGYHRNSDLDISGDTYSFGVNFLDLFIDDDRFGIGYGRQLSDDDRRQGDRPDVLETFYDIRLAPNARAAISWQLRDEFSESVLGFRIRADWDLLELFD
ncbi:carbohydrate porin [Leptothoe spongobia]|uniref:Carbohydrate porin n=1 Tax=Leptothoe spongobia TAU-MAC 1115 TaxID=1967444 RepID=A0A947GKH8_9CYAN|nr:carbohydrate porin [Leptothoe spongobia]MBT9316407.1 carbohydrate porin [Leptothoe spongobia TAU-MAC 1115]